MVSWGRASSRVYLNPKYAITRPSRRKLTWTNRFFHGDGGEVEAREDGAEEEESVDGEDVELDDDDKEGRGDDDDDDDDNGEEEEGGRSEEEDDKDVGDWDEDVDWGERDDGESVGRSPFAAEPIANGMKENPLSNRRP